MAKIVEIKAREIVERKCLSLKPALGLKREVEENLELLVREASMKGCREGA
jgi:hypothetical protein